MGSFDDFIASNPTAFQGLSALGQAFSQAGAPSRVPMSWTQRLGATLPAYNQQMKNLQDTRAIGQGIQAQNPADMMASLGKIQDPEIQKAILASRLAMMTPKFDVTKDAMGNPIAYNTLNPGQNTRIGSNPLDAINNPGGVPSPQPSPNMANNNQAPPMPAETDNNTSIAPQTGIDQNYLNQMKQAAPLAESMAESMINGTFKPEASKGENDPNYVAALQIARKADPTFGPQSFLGRAKMVESTTSTKLNDLGGTKQNLNSVVGHLYDLHEASNDLNNGSSPGINEIQNMVVNQTGYGSQPQISKYNSILSRAAPELNKFYVGGEGDAQGREDSQKPFAANLPTPVIQSNVKTQLGLLNSKANAAQNQYDQQMGAASNWKVITPTSQALIDDANGKPLTSDQQTLVNQHRAESNLPPKKWGNSQPQAGQIQAGTKEYNNAILKAKSAIAQGKNPVAVRARLQQYGIDPNAAGL